MFYGKKNNGTTIAAINLIRSLGKQVNEVEVSLEKPVENVIEQVMEEVYKIAQKQ